MGSLIVVLIMCVMFVYLISRSGKSLFPTSRKDDQNKDDGSGA